MPAGGGDFGARVFLQPLGPRIGQHPGAGDHVQQVRRTGFPECIVVHAHVEDRMVLETGSDLSQVVCIGGDDNSDEPVGVDCIDIVPAELLQGIILAEELPLKVRLVDALGNARMRAAVRITDERETDFSNVRGACYSPTQEDKRGDRIKSGFHCCPVCQSGI